MMVELLKSREIRLSLLLPWMLVALTAVTLSQAELVQYDTFTLLLLQMGSLGFVAGVALALSRFPAFTAHLYSIVYALFALGWLTGQDYPAWMPWRDRILDLVVRQGDWLNAALYGGSSRDSLIFVMHTALLLWLVGYTAAWHTWRKPQLWWVILPGGLVILSVIYYYFGTRPLLLWLALYGLVALLYISHTHLLRSQREWRYKAVRYDQGLAGHFMRAGLVVSMAALILVTQLPALTASASVTGAISQIDQPWRDFQENWQRLFASLTSNSVVSSDFANQLVLDGPRDLSERPVMDVFVEAQLPWAYWRATVLDRYENGTWQLAPGEPQERYPNDPALVPADAAERELVQQRFVNWLADAGTIYAAPDFVSADRPIVVRSATSPSGSQQLVSVRSRFALQPGDSYTVQSAISQADEATLRRLPGRVPDHVRTQYLAVSSAITPRTLELAAAITAPWDNHYDKALAVQNWLRQNISYNDQIAAPPAGAEPVDHFLFDLREGYCNYYASAMAVMLRSQGVPARVALGYAAGEYNPETGMYRVRTRDAHSWPEVYFEGYGWLPFEPTVIFEPVGRSAGESADATENDATESAERPRPDSNPERDEFIMDDPLDEPPPAAPQNPPESAETPTPPRDRTAWWRALFATATVALAGVALWGADKWNRQVEGSLDGSFSRLMLWARWLGISVRPGQTPHERAELLAHTVPEGRPSITWLMGEFMRTRYGSDKQRPAPFRLLAEWRKLRPVFWRRLRATLWRGRVSRERPLPVTPPKKPRTPPRRG